MMGVWIWYLVGVVVWLDRVGSRGNWKRFDCVLEIRGDGDNLINQ